MSDTAEIRAIAHMRSDFSDKFGIPRQSGLVPELEGRIVFEGEYRAADALRGIEGFSRLWLIWQFSENLREGWSPTVRPPRLGGNVRRGVFATRSPFRPNSLGLSCVELCRVDYDAPDGPVLIVKGADLLDGTPIFDIKPYVPYSDSFPHAQGGFADKVERVTLTVDFPPELELRVPEAKRAALRGVLACDPRPGYQHDAERVYGLDFAGVNVRFTVDGDTLLVREVSAL